MSFKKKFNSRPVPAPAVYTQANITAAKLRAAGLDPDDAWKYRRGRLPESEMALWKEALED